MYKRNISNKKQCECACMCDNLCDPIFTCRSCIVTNSDPGLFRILILHTIQYMNCLKYATINTGMKTTMLSIISMHGIPSLHHSARPLIT